MTPIIDNDSPDVCDPLRRQLRESLLRLHGPLMGGQALMTALGHKSAASMRQAKRRGQISVVLFPVPNRRGLFALTQDVADWLARMRCQPIKEDPAI